MIYWLYEYLFIHLSNSSSEILYCLPIFIFGNPGDCISSYVLSIEIFKILETSLGVNILSFLSSRTSKSTLSSHCI